jgi:hypothetical protein
MSTKDEATKQAGNELLREAIKYRAAFKEIEKELAEVKLHVVFMLPPVGTFMKKLVAIVESVKDK